MFESLSARLQAVTERLRGKAKITEADLDVALREIRLALLEADVNFKVVKEFVASVRERALGSGRAQRRPARPAGGQGRPRRAGGRARRRAPPAAASTGKPIGGHAGRSAGLGQDHHGRQAGRAAATRRHASRCWWPPTSIGPPPSTSSSSSATRSAIEVHSRPVGTPALEVARSGLEAARQRGLDLVLLDTAGRLHVDEPMMDELVRDRRRGHAGRDAAGGRRDDRPGGGARRGGVPPSAAGDRPGPDQDGRRRARRRGALHPERHRPADQLHRHRRADRRPGAVPPRPAGPAHPGHGRHPLPGRARPGDGRPATRRSASRSA